MKRLLFLPLLALLAFAACKDEPVGPVPPAPLPCDALVGTQWNCPKNDTLYADNGDGTYDSSSYMIIYNTFMLKFETCDAGKLDIKVGYIIDGVDTPAQTEHSTFAYAFDGQQGVLSQNNFLQGEWQMNLAAPETLRLSYQTVTMDFTKQ